MEVKILESMDNLSMMLTIHLSYLAILIDKIDMNLLTTKVIYASKSLKNKVIISLNQIVRGIKEILQSAHQGIKQRKNIGT